MKEAAKPEFIYSRSITQDRAYDAVMSPPEEDRSVILPDCEAALVMSGLEALIGLRQTDWPPRSELVHRPPLEPLD